MQNHQTLNNEKHKCKQVQNNRQMSTNKINFILHETRHALINEVSFRDKKKNKQTLHTILIS